MIEMTKKLEAALIKLRDADAAYAAARDAAYTDNALPRFNPRSKSGRAAEQKCYDTHAKVRDAAEDVCAVLNPKIERW